MLSVLYFCKYKNSKIVPSNSMCNPVVGIKKIVTRAIFIISMDAIIIDDKRIKLMKFKGFFDFCIFNNNNPIKTRIIALVSKFKKKNPIKIIDAISETLPMVC